MAFGVQIPIYSTYTILHVRRCSELHLNDERRGENMSYQMMRGADWGSTMCNDKG